MSAPKSAETCPACGRPMKKSARVLLEGLGPIRDTFVCGHCYQGRRQVPMVTADQVHGFRMILAPFVRHFRKLAKVYSLDGSEARAAGLTQAADILEEGRAVVLSLEDTEPAPAAARLSGPRCARCKERPPCESKGCDGCSHDPTCAGCPPLHPKKNGAASAVLEHVSSVSWKDADAAARAVDPAATNMDRELLRALVERGEGMDRRQLGIATGYAYRGGAFAGALARLGRSGFIRREGRWIFITAQGCVIAGVAALPTGPALLDFWLDRLTPIEGSILNCIAMHHPEPVARERMQSLTGYQPKGGAFSKAMSKLRALGLVEGWRASSDLMRKAAAHGA